MATTKNITMKQFNGTDYDILYPKTDVKQIENLTPSSIGAVSKSGDTMTGNLTIKNPSYSVLSLRSDGDAKGGDIEGGPNTINLVQFTGKDDSQYRQFSLRGIDRQPNAKIALEYVVTGEGENVTYKVLHTGNAQSLGFLKIAIGSYTGTGTYGADSPNTLNLGVVPKLVLIMSTTETKFTTGAEGGYANYGIFDPNITQMGAVRGSIHVSFSGTTLSWYADVNSNYYPETQQLNKSGVVYKWYVLY